MSTRKVDDLLQATRLTGIDKSKVSRICKKLDEVVEGFCNRRLEREYPYLPALAVQGGWTRCTRRSGQTIV